MKIALIGTGLLGSAIAQRLLAHDVQVVVYNRTKDRTQTLVKLGACAVDSTEEAFAFSDCIITVLSDGAATEKLVLDSANTLTYKTIIQMGTISPDESKEIGRQVVKRGGDYLECPVLGSRTEAKNGTLLVMAAGERKLFDQYEYLLKLFDQHPKFVGEWGSAALLKLALNQLIASHIIGLSVSLALVEQSGINREMFLNVLKSSSLHCPMFDKKIIQMMAHEYSNPNFPTAHLLKDVKLIEACTDQLHINHSSLHAFKNILEQAVQNGLGDKDYSSVFEVIMGKN